MYEDKIPQLIEEIANSKLAKDITGHKFGKLLVIRPVSKCYYGYKWECKCDCGNIVIIVSARLFGKNKTKQCINCRNVSHRLKYENVKKYFEDNGCELLSLEYKNSQEKLDYICVCGNKSVIKYNCFQQGNRCWKCKSLNMKGDKNPAYRKDREILKFEQKFREKCFDLLKHTIRHFDEFDKKEKTYKLLGYTPLELKSHIENHPNWPNVKDQEWSIDHIFPIKAFMEHKIFDIKLINCLENLRPLSSLENMQKNCLYDKKEFIEWLSNKGITINA